MNKIDDPITIFSKTINPIGVLNLIKSFEGDAFIEGNSEDWSKVTFIASDKLGGQRIVFTHSKEYYSEPNWSKQLTGMIHYFDKFPKNENHDLVKNMISEFTFCIGTIMHVEYDENDPRLDLIYQIAQLVDGIIFTPLKLSDSSGKTIIDIKGNQDPDCYFPQKAISSKH